MPPKSMNVGMYLTCVSDSRIMREIVQAVPFLFRIEIHSRVLLLMQMAMTENTIVLSSLFGLSNVVTC